MEAPTKTVESRSQESHKSSASNCCSKLVSCVSSSFRELFEGSNGEAGDLTEEEVRALFECMVSYTVETAEEYGANISRRACAK